ncbi:DUF3048 domain-containing protein [Microcella sp.]|jgi:hypothetical protein|uniref:DUF3048 domain-containing protein n=1 Tax=Microcella sp. TaxID=1913979 RepID=UPI00391BCE60
MSRGCARGLVAVLGVAAVLGAAGCTAPEAPMPTPTPSPSYVSTYVPPPEYGIAPLTGEQIEVGALTAPSLAAKVDNHPSARPQVGLDRTDIVFEELVEGGLTRYVAVWHSDVPSVIGPVRSIRPMDPEIISPLGGIVAYSGGQQRFVQLMLAAPVYNAIHGQSDTASTFYRGDNAPAPHNVLVKAPQLISQHLDLAAPRQQFAFAESLAAASATKEGRPTSAISLVFGSSSAPVWKWGEKTQRWVRFMTGGERDMAASGEQLSADNVVVLRVPVQVISSIPTTKLIGSGEAWVSSGGATIKATWSKRSLAAPIRLLDANGVAVRLAPGNTWVELVPLAGSVTFSRPAQ